MHLNELHITAGQLKEGLVVPVDKPRQWSSFQVVNYLKWQVRRELGIKNFKIGHAGTLDPLASGLLLLCLGPATKRIPALQDAEKRYTGTMILGATTPCYDLERAVDTYYPVAQITQELLETVRQQFLGCQLQTPPMFSAVKVNGKRAYVAARSMTALQQHKEASQPGGNGTVIKEKSVTIYQFDITAFRSGYYVWQSPCLGIPGFAAGQPAGTASQTPSASTQLYRTPLGIVPDWLPQIDFAVRCSKGTYIRSLARDFGMALSSGAFLAALRRTQIGDYGIEAAYTL